VKQRFHYGTHIDKEGAEIRSLYWMCPGCEDIHRVTVSGKNCWSLTLKDDLPTVMPSVLVHPWKSKDPQYKSQPRCHGHLVAGRYVFCADCEHKLAGQTVDLPEFEL
jgi:hypothetical protein